MVANVVWGPSLADPAWLGSVVHFWLSVSGRIGRTAVLAQLMEVSAVKGATITFDTPLTYPFHTASDARAIDDIHGRFISPRCGRREPVCLGRHGRRHP